MQVRFPGMIVFPAFSTENGSSCELSAWPLAVFREDEWWVLKLSLALCQFPMCQMDDYIQ